MLLKELRRQNIAETSGKMYVSASSLTNAKTKTLA